MTTTPATTANGFAADTTVNRKETPMSDATQALFPVTPEARKAACEYLSDIAGLRGGDAVTDIHDDHPTLIAFARFERDILARQAHSLPGDVGMREAAQAVIDTADDYYTARNGRRCSIEGGDGEKCWIVPFDPFEDLRRALATADSWMTISVDEAAQTIGIDHPTKADWIDVCRAMIAVRDHINDRIAKQEGCPVRPAALTPSALSGDAGEGRGHWLIERRCNPPQWSVEPRPTGIGAFYSDIHRAHRFASKHDAAQAMRAMSITDIERGEYFVSEHVWIEHD